MRKEGFSIQEICELTSGEVVLGSASSNSSVSSSEMAFASGFSIDTRTIRHGDLFVAIKGELSDGHNYVQVAAEKGGVAALVRSDYKSRCGVLPLNFACILVNDPLKGLWELARENRKRNKHVKVIAVTGSNGKTTTKEMLASVFREAVGVDRVLCNKKSYNNHLGVPLTLMELKPHHEFCVTEIGMNAPGEIKALAELARPEVGVITSVGEAHLQGLRTLENIAAAKSELFESLSGDGVAVFPELDKKLMSILMDAAIHIEEKKKILFGRGEKAQVRLLDSYQEVDGRLFCKLGIDNLEIDARLPLLGLHNGMNAAATGAAAHAMGVQPELIKKGLENVTPPPHRSVLLKIGGARILDDCYNANPPSMKAGLNTLFNLPEVGLVGVIMGDMLELGDASEKHHEELGRDIARRKVDLALFVGEKMQRAAEGARDAGMDREKIHLFADAFEAGEYAAESFGEGWSVLVKGSRRTALEKALETWSDRVGETSNDSVRGNDNPGGLR